MKKHNILYIPIAAAIIFFISFSLTNHTYNTPKPTGKPKVISNPEPELSPEENEFLQDFALYIHKKFKDTKTPGASIAIVKNGYEIYKEALGLKSANHKDSIDNNTLFRLASVSKGFSAILAGLMVRDSLITWNDPIAAYFSSVKMPKHGNSITVRNILSHTGGFPYQAFSTLIEDELPRDIMIQRLFTLKLSRSPGQIHSYQNVAYSIIEPILESVTGEPFNQLMYEHIFTPLKMNNASITYDSMVNNSNIAQPHGYRNKSFVPMSLKPSYYNVAAAGGINASINDMSKWLKAVLGGEPEIIPTEILDQVFTPVIQIRVKNPYFSHLFSPRQGYYGMGWRIMDYPQDTVVYHGGYANGYKSGIAIDRNKNIGICVLTNAPSKFSNLVLTEFFKRYYEKFGHDSNHVDIES